MEGVVSRTSGTTTTADVEVREDPGVLERSSPTNSVNR